MAVYLNTPSRSKCAYPSLNHVVYLTLHLSHISEDEHFMHHFAVVVPSMYVCCCCMEWKCCLPISVGYSCYFLIIINVSCVYFELLSIPESQLSQHHCLCQPCSMSIRSIYNMVGGT